MLNQKNPCQGEHVSSSSNTGVVGEKEGCSNTSTMLGLLL